jgi:hypothetical protein
MFSGSMTASSSTPEEVLEHLKSNDGHYRQDYQQASSSHLTPNLMVKIKVTLSTRYIFL